jgi:hypothetical protein
MEMEQKQTNCEEEGKQSCSIVLNLASTHFFCLAKAPLITKMVGVAIKQVEDEKKNIRSRWKFKTQLVFISSTTTSFGNKDDRRGKKPQQNSNFGKACSNFLFRLATSSFTIKQQH